jgi:hypothetical protein
MRLDILSEYWISIFLTILIVLVYPLIEGVVALKLNQSARIMLTRLSSSSNVQSVYSFSIFQERSQYYKWNRETPKPRETIAYSPYHQFPSSRHFN